MKSLIILLLLSCQAYAQVPERGIRPLLVGLSGVYTVGFETLGGELEVGAMFRKPEGTAWLLGFTGGMRYTEQHNPIVFSQEEHRIPPIGEPNGSGEFKEEWEGFYGINLGYQFSNGMVVVLSPSLIHSKYKIADKFGENIFVLKQERDVYLGSMGMEMRASVYDILQLRLGYSSRLGFRTGLSGVFNIATDSAIHYGDSVAPLYVTVGAGWQKGITLGFVRGSNEVNGGAGSISYHPVEKYFSLANSIAFPLGESVLPGCYTSLMTTLGFDFTEFGKSPGSMSLNLGWRSFGSVYYDPYAGGGVQTTAKTSSEKFSFKPIVNGGIAIGFMAGDVL